MTEFRDTPALRRLAASAIRIRRDREPMKVTIVLPVLDLGRQRKLLPGLCITLPAAEARELIARSAARPYTEPTVK